MKKIIKIVLLFLLVACAFKAHAQDYRGYVVIKSSTLEEQRDTLHMALEVLVKQHGVQNHTGMRILPKLVSEENTLVFPDILIQGKNKRKTYDRWVGTMNRGELRAYEAPDRQIRVSDATDTVLYYNYRVPYQDWMDYAQLVVEQELIDYRTVRSLVTFAMDSRIKLSPRVPYVVQPAVNYIEPQPENKRRAKQGSAFLDFQVNKSVILPGFRRNPQELQKIRHAFEEVMSNKDVQIEGLFIEGYASPEGRVDNNERLARERAHALKNYIMRNFRVVLPEESVKISWVAEDWDGLKSLIEHSDFRYKESVLKIIEETSDINQRKLKLQRLAGGAAYRMMLQDIYPQLRRVEYQIDFSVRDFTVEETKNLLSSNSNGFLSYYEMFRAAQTYDKTSREFENIMLEIAPQLFPDNPEALINASSVLIMRGEYLTAKRYLERFEDNPQVWNNLGVVYMIEGNYEKAEKLLIKAKENGVTEAQHNLDELVKKLLDVEKMERYKNRQK